MSPSERLSNRRRQRAARRRFGVLVATAGGGIGVALLLNATVEHGGAAAHPQSAAPVTHDVAPRVVRSRPPLAGAFLIADRGNDRILLVNVKRRVLWHFPTRRDLARGLYLRFNDDSFVADGGRAIVANEEEAHTIVSIDIRTHKRVHLYGLPGVRGSSPGLLNTPDDAYPLQGGSVVVADAYNCRVVWVRAHRIVRTLGQTGVCRHDPPHTFGAVNGDTPLQGGGLLVSEIPGHWVDEIGPRGRLRWAVQAPVGYPSDPQPVAGGLVLLADYSDPGQVVIINRFGSVLWRYGPRSGPGMLNHPSLALLLPGGRIAINDDYRDRVVVIDMRTRKIVWQYGHTDLAGTRPGFLNTPDGLDFVPLTAAGAPDWAAVHHPAAPQAWFASVTPARRSAAVPVAAGVSGPRLLARRIGSLPLPASRLAAVALPDGKVLALGGLVGGGTSSAQVLIGRPPRLVAVGSLPTPSHDAAAALVGRAVELFGGGEASSVNSVVRVDPASGRARLVARLDEPLSDLGVAKIAGTTYLVGGYTGSRYASAILRVGADGSTTTVARLPTGVRYAGVAVLDSQIYVAGGLTIAGATSAIYRVDPATGQVTMIGYLPEPISHAPLVAFRGALYLVGGSNRNGAPLEGVLRVSPRGAVSTAGKLPVALADAAAVVAAGKLIVLGGAGATLSDSIYELSS